MLSVGGSRASGGTRVAPARVGGTARGRGGAALTRGPGSSGGHSDLVGPLLRGGLVTRGAFGMGGLGTGGLGTGGLGSGGYRRGGARPRGGSRLGAYSSGALDFGGPWTWGLCPSGGRVASGA